MSSTTVAAVLPAPADGIETCARLMIGSPPSPIFVKGTWFPRHFLLHISDGLQCWTCHATEQAVAERAAGWDESVSEYLRTAQFHLSHQHPNSTYTFLADGENRKLSWTMEKHGTKLEGKWRCEKTRTDQEITCNILNFLMNSNIKLSDEVLRKTQSFERMKAEAEKCLKQSEQFKNEKQQFETEIFRKFVAVLNSKKSKLRELRDKLARFEPAARQGDNEEEETDAEEIDEDDDVSDRSNDGDDKAASTGPNERPIAGEMPRETQAEEAKPEIQVAGESVQRESDAGSSQVQNATTKEAVDSAAALLADSAYTSAPKRRRRV